MEVSLGLHHGISDNDIYAGTDFTIVFDSLSNSCFPGKLSHKLTLSELFY